MPPKPSRPWKKILIPLAILALVLIGWRVYAKRNQPDDSKDIYKVTRKDLTRTLSISGKVMPVESMVVTAPQEGRIITIATQAGTLVNEGELLFTMQLETRGQQDLIRQESEIKRLRVEVEAMEVSLKDRQNVRELLATSTIIKDETELEKLRLQLREAEERYALAKREMGLGRQKPSKNAPAGMAYIRAPRAGIVTLVDKRPGDYVGTGMVAADNVAGNDRTVMVIADMSQLMVRTRVMEADLRYVEKGLPVTVKLEAFPDMVYRGKVLAIGGQGRVDKTAGYTYFDVDVSVDNSNAKVLPEMNATVDLTFARRDGVLSLPVAAVALFPDRAFVLKRNPADAKDFVETPIEVGLVNEQDVEITKGLAEGDEVREIDFAKVFGDDSMKDGPSRATGGKRLGKSR